MEKKIVRVFICLMAAWLSSCQTYYFANEEFNNAFRAGNFEFCETWLKKNKPSKRSKNKFLYQANLGMIEFIRNKPDVSNQAFEAAFLIAEDYQKKAGENVAALFTNPKRITYGGERHELLLLNYFKALNQIKAGQTENALVETRRLIRKLNVNLDQGKKNKYNADGFMLWMVGCFFESAGEVNNAFIYYRKAVNAYQGSFGSLTRISTPQQLKIDVVRSAWEAGFESDAQMFESKFGIKNKVQNSENGTALIIWNKGLGPVKDESRITFQLVKGLGGAVTFNNEEMGWSFPFFLPLGEFSNPNRFDNLKIITMALPKYVNRNYYWKQMNASVDGQRYDFQPATNLEAVAKADLEDRSGRELAKAISRVAMKQAIQYTATKATESAVKNGRGDKGKKQQQADLAGSLVNLAFTFANTATEVADTRNWQTLPAEIQILRISLPQGKHFVQFGGSGKDGKPLQNSVELEIRKGQTTFHSVHTF